MKKYKLILAIMCTGVLVLTGCGGTSSSTTNVTGQEEQATQEETTKEDNPLLINEIREGSIYECIHTLSDIYVDEIIIDTEKLTVEMVLGS